MGLVKRNCWRMDGTATLHSVTPLPLMHYGFYRDKQKVINELGHCNRGMLRHYVNHGAKMQKRAKEFLSPSKHLLKLKKIT